MSEDIKGHAAAAGDTLAGAMDKASEWRDTVVAFTKSQPTAALLMAVSAGFALRMMTQSSRR